tara:strand:- start:554 stop:964 length:411 start_codon:yes stop_codon:yes gene_type:complete
MANVLISSSATVSGSFSRNLGKYHGIYLQLQLNETVASNFDIEFLGEITFDGVHSNGTNGTENYFAGVEFRGELTDANLTNFNVNMNGNLSAATFGAYGVIIDLAVTGLRWIESSVTSAGRTSGSEEAIGMVHEHA